MSEAPLDYFPLFLNLKGRSALIVGGGEIAHRKAALLLRCGAQVTVVAPDVVEKVKNLPLEWLDVPYASSLLQEKRYMLVVAATDSPSVNEQVARDAEETNALVNVVSDPSLCSFIFPSVIDRSPVVIAVSTGGASPVLARMLRTKLESLIPMAYGRLASLIGRCRDRLKAMVESLNAKRGFWEEVIEGPVAELVFANRENDAEALLETKLREAATAAASEEGPTCPAAPRPSASDREATNGAMASGAEKSGGVGEVYLVGAGPGDPDLLTFRALRLMQQADVVVYDRLVSKEILDLCRRDAEMINAGKEPKHHTIPQSEINDLLTQLALKGRRVLRLKGGDPFIFGRGGEELVKLCAHQIPFQVVPGITAASGCSAYCGIPLTHRDYAQSVRFLTGHAREDHVLELPWDNLVHSNRETLVFYMGMLSLGKIFSELISHGMPPARPAAVVQQGTTPEQRVLVGTLESLPGLVESADPKIKPPALVIVGEVVGLHKKLWWFGQPAD